MILKPKKPTKKELEATLIKVQNYLINQKGITLSFLDYICDKICTTK